MNETLDEILRPFADRARSELEALARHRRECIETFCETCDRFACRACGSHIVTSRGMACPMCAEREADAGFRAHALATIPARFEWASFGNEILRERVAPFDALGKAKLAVAGGRDVLILGPAGAGKTSLVVAMLRQAIADAPRRSWRCSYMFTSSYALSKARVQHPLGQGECQAITAAIEAGILVIDDLGAEPERHDKAVSEVIHERHDAMRTTWVTSGFPFAEIQTRYGAGIARRVFEQATHIELARASAARMRAAAPVDVARKRAGDADGH